MIGKWMMIGFVAGLLSMAGCATVTEKTMKEKGLAPMTQSELQALHSQERTCDVVWASGYKGKITFYQNGAFMTMLDKEGQQVHGLWQIKGDRFCLKGEFDRKEMCLTAYKISEKEFAFFEPEGAWYNTRRYTN